MITVISAHRNCAASPSTYTGKTSGGATVYARYRWGHLSVRIDPTESPRHNGAAGSQIVEKTIGGEFHGFLSYADLRQHTAETIEWPDELSDPESGPSVKSTDPTNSTDSLTL